MLQKHPQAQLFGKYIYLIIVLISILIISSTSEFFANSIHPSLAFLDPDGVYLWISIHHLFQLILTIFLLLGIGGKNLKLWGFNFNNWKSSIIWIVVFACIWFLIEYMRISGKTQHTLPYSLNNTNLIGIQCFQYFLSGLCEEPLFRGFVIIFLANQWQAIYKPLGFEIPQTVLISAGIFMLAHLNINIFELSVGQFDIDQQIKALQLGIVYGISFHYTKSLLAPILMHGLSNGIQFSLIFSMTL